MSKILTDKGFVEVGGELYHHGVLGMKWGVRRYQNKDGSYTTAGLKRYRESEKKYDTANSAYKKAKRDYDSGKISKGKLKETRIDKKYAKKEMNRNYNQLKYDVKADKGHSLAAKGRSVRGNNARIYGAKIGIGIIGATAASIAAKSYLQSHGRTIVGRNSGRAYTPELQYQLAKIGISAITLGTVAGIHAKNESANRNLRAYYNHSRPKTSTYANNAARKKQNINPKDYTYYKK